MNHRTHMTTIAAALAGLTALAGPGTAAVQSPEYDVSGLAIFWETADILAADREPTEADWRRLLDHPGYRQIERLGGRAEAVRRCLPLVFRPSMRDGLADALEDGGSRVRRVCEHLDQVRTRRDELRRFERTVAEAGDELSRAIELAATYLPEGATNGPAPATHVILFEMNGFGGESVALDAALLRDLTAEQRAEYLAHEFHHVFRRRADRIEIDEDDPRARLVGALDNLAAEGIASLLDKRRWLEPGYAESVAEFWHPIISQFGEFYRGSPDVLSEVDRRLAAVATGELEPEQAGREIGRLLPWGGHPTGMYMARAIEGAEGRARIAELAADPLEFILEYQTVAEADRDLYRFSDGAIALVRDLRRMARARNRPESRSSRSRTDG